MGEYERAETLFSKLARDGKPPLKQKAALLRGESLKNMNRTREAKESFEGLYTSFPDSPYASKTFGEWGFCECIFDPPGAGGHTGS